VWQNWFVLFAVVLAVAIAVDPAGLAAWKERRSTAAENAFRNTLRRDPSDGLTRVWLARALFELNRPAEAVNEIQRALTEPVAPEVRFQAGRVLRELAERRLARLEAIAPESPVTHELAGEKFEWAGNMDEALAEYRAAAKIANDRPGVHYRIGNVLWFKRETDAALAELRKELALNPQHGMANLRVAQALMQSDQTAEAVPFFERALAAMPESIEARRDAGKAFRKAGRTSDARVQWEAVAKARPNDDQIHYLLAGLYREIGETGLAKVELEKHRALLAARNHRPE
jgi:tetratricopeptide (TPR) repeat protein